MEINDNSNKSKVAIVVIGYNRISGLVRLLDSINNADYPNNGIPLVIAIDASGNEALYEYARKYNWTNGEKYVIIQERRLGLKEHIYRCGDLSQHFRGIIILEDDIFVASDFYNYTLSALDKFENESKVAGISLYAEDLNGYACLPFKPLNNGSDCYAWQTVCSWGQCWTYSMWSKFRSWLLSWDKNFDLIDMPEQIKGWDRAWSKFFYAYIILNDLYFIYPYVSLTTNFNDAGGEHGGGSSFVQVSLQAGKRDYHFYDFEDLVKYDVYQHNVAIYDSVGISEVQLGLDLYGNLPIDVVKKKYLLSVKILPYKIVRTYGLCLRPVELNILMSIKGEGIYLYDTTIAHERDTDASPYLFIDYQLRCFKTNLLLKYLIYMFKERVFRKIKKLVKIISVPLKLGRS